ncbi:thioredoxin reductase [Deinobacterium chartae]|uniref:Thioredoxin reductase n=1 Tax=Deinobacterium chartae TaxID=521158 RepID=A0A841HVV2_9DEIO|nr:NAD(P)/FAD-dependent oxidoreductase [Deinobacterium chartae]MBB6096963.1 thioredoxin reductase [Deinobacterium chartae]
MTDYDVIVVGGSAAGLSAALTLGRARRRVLLLDRRTPRNAPVAHSHGFLTRDGTPPGELRRIAHEQLEPYGTELRFLEALRARSVSGGFELDLEDGSRVRAARLLLATGVRDLLPDLPGLRERWGRSVHACPYCHGWEVQDRPLAVLGRSESGYHKAVMLHHWSRDTVLLTDGPSGLTPERLGQLAALGIAVLEDPLSHLEGAGDALERVVFRGGRVLAREALFLQPDVRPASDLAAQLGCKMSDNGHNVVTDAAGQTSVPGVYAAGDMVEPAAHQIAHAVSSGARAAASLNNALIFAAALEQA